MNKKKEFFLLLFVIVYVALIYFINMTLNNNNWYLRGWVFSLSFIIILLSVFVFLILRMIHIKSTVKKSILIIIIIAFAFFSFVTGILCTRIIKNDDIKEIDNNKYLGIESLSNRNRKTIIYYQEYNIFAYHKTEEYIEEFYDTGNNEIPEFREYHKNPLQNSKIYYYDEDGNVKEIKTYDNNGELIDINEEKDNVLQYNYSYGEIFKIENNTIYYGDVKEKKGDYLSQKLSENFKVIDYESEKIISNDDIEVGDFVTLATSTESFQNDQPIIIVAKKDYISEEVNNRLFNKRELNTELIYYNETEKYITVGIYLDRKVIKDTETQPVYYLDLSVGDNTETYLGWKENNPNSNYGYHLYELCTVELTTKITDLSNKYMVKSIEFIAD